MEKPRVLTRIRRLGKGAEATVDLVEDTRTKELLAQRTIVFDDPGDISEFLKEVLIMKQLSESKECSKYAVCLKGYTYDDASGSILMTYIPNAVPLMFTYVEMREKLSFSLRWVLFRNALRSWTWLHRLGIYHADLHEGNIMVNPHTLQVWLIDFGMAMSEKSVRFSAKLSGRAPAPALKTFQKLYAKGPKKLVKVLLLKLFGFSPRKRRGRKKNQKPPYRFMRTLTPDQKSTIVHAWESVQGKSNVDHLLNPHRRKWLSPCGNPCARTKP